MTITVARALADHAKPLAAWLALQPVPPDQPLHTARAEVEALLCSVAGWSQLALLTALSSPLSDPLAASLTAKVALRLQGQPLQYLLGEAPFYGRAFAVAPGCLIPRPETETLVQTAVAWIERYHPTAHVVDLGTGSGCIAVSIALACPQTTVVGVDISAAALQLAQANVARHAAPVRLLEHEGIAWLGNGSPGATRPNVLVSNPPYIPSADIAALAAEVGQHEPHSALDGGADGLAVYRAISELGPGMFAPGPAACLFEVGAGQHADVLTMFAQSPQWRGWTFTVIPDLRGIGRVVQGQTN